MTKTTVQFFEFTEGDKIASIGINKAYLQRTDVLKAAFERLLAEVVIQDIDVRQAHFETYESEL